MRAMYALTAAALLMTTAAGLAQENQMTTKYQSLANDASCDAPENVWIGRYVVRAAEEQGKQLNVMACFPTQPACEDWLSKANSYVNHGTILTDQCAQKKS
ncbi:hypothetical protein SAMN02745172_02850 [Pseudoxanthobacter soli DSM 19599]|uniref:Uncharacterized protein n=2 Tax=Pseudoxanthobacter TaxID=433838 RepID=A0A1M7ZMS3_9HYPH|nr:hypothetical protein SAMN02745172_02850 [Pseudoxanthobacter soli DSM 19599]